VERQKADQAVKEAVQHGLAEITTATQRYEEQQHKSIQALQEMAEQRQTDLKALISKQEENQLRQHEHLVEQAKTEIDQVVSSRLQEDIHRREQEIYEQEELRPFREAARTATERVALQEKQVQAHKRLKNGLIGLDVLAFLALIVMLLFLSLPQWIIAVLLVIIAAIIITVWIWKSPVPEDTLMRNRKEVTLFQTKSGDYASPLGEEEQCALLVQHVDQL
jgi:hypothetical protein